MRCIAVYCVLICMRVLCVCVVCVVLCCVICAVLFVLCHCVLVFSPCWRAVRGYHALMAGYVTLLCTRGGGMRSRCSSQFVDPGLP